MAPTDETKVKPLFAAQQPGIPEPGPSGVQMLRMAVEIAAARSLLLIALIGAIGLWAWTVVDPSLLRLYTATGFSFSCLLPLVWLAYKRG